MPFIEENKCFLLSCLLILMIIFVPATIITVLFKKRKTNDIQLKKDYDKFLIAYICIILVPFCVLCHKFYDWECYY
jgi:uncharacterized membrane protein YraQ (UPF0718 family)